MENAQYPPDSDLLVARIEGASPDDPRILQPMKLEVTRENGKLKRSSFACVGCHSLKQKCWPSDLDDIYRKPCQRCLRQKKICTFDLSKRTRKRQPRKSKKNENSSPNDLPSDSLSNKQSDSSSSSPVTQKQKRPISSLYQDNENIQIANSNISMNSFASERDTKPFTSSKLNLSDNLLNNNSNITNQQMPTPTILPGIQSLSGIWPGPVTGTTPVSQESPNNGVSLSNNPSPTKLLTQERNPMTAHTRKKSLNQTSIHLNHSFKKQLQSLLVNQKGKGMDLSTKFTTWSEKWNDVVQTTMFLPSIKDPIAVGILSTNEADVRLKLYKQEISTLGKLSFIKIPPDITVDQLRSEKPILFSVIMSTVSVIMKENETTRETIMKLDSFVINLLTNQIFKVNNKSIEIIESHIVLCTWYNFLEWSNKTRYHLFNYIGCCLTKDLGPMFVNRAFAMFSDVEPKNGESKFKSPLELYTNGPRIILLVYITSLNISIFLKQTIQLKWSDLVKLAADRLQTQIDEYMSNQSSVYSDSNYDIEDDIVLISFARLNHQLEKIHVYLHEMTDLFDLDDVSIRERYIEKLLIKYRGELHELFDSMPKHRKRLLTFYYSVEAYFHQFEIQYYLKKLSEMKQKGITSGEVYTSIEANAVRSFIECYNCCISALQEFSQLTPTLIASIPLFLMSRLIYTVGVLLLRLRYSVVAFPIFHHLLELTDNCVLMVNDVRELLNKSSQQYPYNYFLYKFQYVVILFVQTYANKVIDLFESTTGTSKLPVSSGSSLLDESIQLNPQVLFNRSQDNTWITPRMKNINGDRHIDDNSLFNTRENIKMDTRSNSVNNANLHTNFNKSNQEIRNQLNYNNNSNNNSNNNDTIANSNGIGILNNENTTPLLNLSNGNNANANMESLGNANDIKRSVSAMSFNHMSKPINSEMRTSSPSVSITSDNLNEYLTDVNSLAWGFNALNDEFWTDLFIDDM
ncbi:similar to Saccharomyces cerevisiae YML076C WAR1 Homodimeric Zn2Cys6 zinc finger transcription factor [Maudiozyma saulgeensis]|uniref:Similar to Saccharomyces cerevisiae YML076C WAR1 Homodimeric Zn2Cys6 zinc finger transcription factor n=1 Tax=Maudiozyma saulgeensis TaxID=1789683 RepID=A0A1X7QZA0_9SACH|nr:similar to Saccharomyces cerevisiae YML076C WAR1 Homodimeric Zn2Cys6 zinc finger transcription factor [Kazachstania saulgeensis]